MRKWTLISLNWFFDYKGHQFRKFLLYGMQFYRHLLILTEFKGLHSSNARLGVMVKSLGHEKNCPLCSLKIKKDRPVYSNHPWILGNQFVAKKMVLDRIFIEKVFILSRIPANLNRRGYPQTTISMELEDRTHFWELQFNLSYTIYANLDSSSSKKTKTRWICPVLGKQGCCLNYTLGLKLYSYLWVLDNTNNRIEIIISFYFYFHLSFKS